MKKIYLIPALAVLSALVLFACQREISGDLPLNPPPPADILVEANYMGRITDESGAPLSNVDVSAGNKSVQTDQHGIFRLEKINVFEQFGHVKAVKPGYFPGIRTVISNKQSSNFVEIQLIKRELKGRLEAGSDAVVEIAGGVFVTFSKGSFVNAAGTIYKGDVKVFGAFLNPESDEFIRIMPGDLRAITSANTVTALQSYGMIAIELEGTAGEKLQLAPLNTANISMNIPASMRAGAPATMPLWYFDESDGKWKEEGQAIRTGDVYSGNVSHFTYWNYDVPVNFVYLSFYLNDQNNNPVPYTTVKVVDTRNNSYGTASTDSTGYLKLWVPKDAPLELHVINTCNEILSKQNIGPYTNDEHISSIDVTVPASGSATITGNALGCEQNPVTNGFVSIFVDGLYYKQKITDGSFSVLINRCSQTATDARIYVNDISTNKESEIKTVNIRLGEYDAGMLEACEIESKEYFRFTIGQEEYEMTFPTDSVTFYRDGLNTTMYLSSNEGSAIDLTVFSFPLTDTIPMEVQYTQSIIVNDIQYNPDTLYLNLKKYGRVNEYIEMELRGHVVKDSTFEKLAFVGNVRVRRRN